MPVLCVDKLPIHFARKFTWSVHLYTSLSVLLSGSRVRLATLEMSVLLLKTLVYREDQCYLQDCHLAALEGAKEEATLLLRNFYKVWEKV